MCYGVPCTFGDLGRLRVEVRALVEAGRVAYNLRYVRSKGHVEIERWHITALLLHGAYSIDKDSKETSNRFVSRARIGRNEYKCVFEVHECPHGRYVSVGTAYCTT